MADPPGTGVCFDKVVAYYKGPKGSHCCNGWKQSDPKFPKANNDSGPIILPLCGTDSRRLSLYLEVRGQR